MSEPLRRCSICQALIDEEDLFCANCGTEAPHAPHDSPADSALVSTHNFTCQGCGASMSYDASAQSLRCPFCGSTHLDEQPDAKSLSPQQVVPFAIEREQALAAMRKWLGQGFWRPGDLASAAEVAKMTAVYVPYWVFSARTFTYWTADSDSVPFGASGDWVPVSGQHAGEYSGLLVGASSALSPRETAELCPFDLSVAVSPNHVDLENMVVEQFRVQRKYARPLAQQAIEQREAAACEQYVSGRCRNVRVNVRLQGLTSVPVLLPVWVMAYQYRGNLFRFLINGQTGKATGQAPFSWRKLIAVIAGIFLILVGVISCAGLWGILAR
ncbi:MAG: hypothetical protein R3C99_14565 [Pirellulaceae bacterium]|nr:hypothetical protein [Planctomycetales bacterium]